ncbi:hypothetical protein DL96DRAFT_882695 [Flagelloscypha sp. PMI_526]|nr:hypothetical protein DL96DRAFT_882695 [Flagelloscypha sp. PMI_526]
MKVYTADSHLNQMLSLCEMLASGLGAPVKDSSTSTASDAGNVPIRLFTAQTRLSLLRNGKAKGKGVGGKGRVSLEDEPKLIKMVEVFEKRVEEVREFGKSLFLVSDHDEKSADNTDGEDEKRVAALLKH